MGRIVIVPAEQSREYIHPIPGDSYGMHRLSYEGAGNYVMPLAEPMSLDPLVVKRVLDELQDTVPLGAIVGPEGEYPVLLVDGQLLAGPDPASALLEGERHEGWIVLAGNTANPRDLTGHEFTHELLRSWVDRMEEEQFFALISQLRGDELDPDWEDRPQERLAEYVSTAVFNDPLDHRMPDLNPAILERVRVWALAQFAGGERAEVVIAGEEPAPEEQPYIVLTINSPKALVGGAEVPIDPANPVVTPIIMRDRTMVPLRFVAEHMGFRVEWDEVTRQVRIYRPNDKPLPK